MHKTRTNANVFNDLGKNCIFSSLRIKIKGKTSGGSSVDQNKL